MKCPYNAGRSDSVMLHTAGSAVVDAPWPRCSGPSLNHAKQLQWLRNEPGDRFIGGAVLHSGPRTYPLTERIVAAPICALWAW